MVRVEERRERQGDTCPRYCDREGDAQGNGLVIS